MCLWDTNNPIAKGERKEGKDRRRGKKGRKRGREEKEWQRSGQQ
jgi:hypothetical protein